MKTVIGLFLKEADVQHAICKLKNFGLTDDKISVLTREEPVRKLLCGNQTRVVEKSAIWGILFGLIIFDSYGLTVKAHAWDGFLGSSSPPFWGFVMGLLSVVIGTFLGVFLGWFFGVER